MDRGALTTAEQAFALFTAPRPQGMQAASSGVWALTVAETSEEGLVAFEDPIVATATGPANVVHALLDFSVVPEKRWRKVGQRLKQRAVARGARYRP